MSAWIVSRDHLDLLLTAALAWEITPPGEADETGRMLWKENLVSVAYPYPYDRDGDRPGPIDFRDRHVGTYRFQPYPGPVDPEVVAAAGASLAYQSCEHPGWTSSTAYRWTTHLRAQATARVAAYLDEHGPVNPKRQTRGEQGWYVLVDLHGQEQVRCGDGWSVPDRGVFTRAFGLLTLAAVRP
ncbi:hypothetical protein GCM10010172_31450 [Paractinoplanes ferrugineus]|uniref:Uncharacterized protein n=1 Tax=Paractinoplanes ferrugineus TaxID=113564 RepID=A0A919MFV0_9ACTN|nr:hypothetical protein [Actinoplanes ferrugineus]GIE14163.1 hypothetical protein Afe05nite_60030 [Actinoplanes ferrugineus]